jgi:integrase
MAEHLARHIPNDPTALVFTSPQGAPLRNSNFRRQVWYSAVEQAGLPRGLRVHDLRHTCASLLIAAGANPKAFQVHLGHSSISVTMDRHTHFFPSDIDAFIGRPNRGPTNGRGESNSAEDDKPPYLRGLQHARRDSNPQPSDP